MDQFRVDPSFDGKSLVRTVLSRYPTLSAARVFQALRRKDIRVNRQRQNADCTVRAGDEITLYISGEAFVSGDTYRKAGDAAVGSHAFYAVVYQDPLIIILHKKPGIAVQPGQRGKAGRLPDPDLLTIVRQDFGEPSIELCHRLDLQTGGLLILSRKPAGLAAVRDLMRAGSIIKRYCCLVRGVPQAGDPISTFDGLDMLEISAWLKKDAGESLVHIHNQKMPGDLPIITRYRFLEIYDNAGPDGEAVSFLEIELPTGRTHQIRAHLAHIGHPLVGDGKYGRNVYNRFFRGRTGPVTRQQLAATALIFLPGIQGPLAGLAGQTFYVEPDFDWKPEK